MLTLCQAKAVLEVLGYRCSERNLRQWSYSGALPHLERRVGPERESCETTYAWDDNVIAQIFTVTWFMNDRARLEGGEAPELVAGFDYSVEEMRDLWIGWSDREVAQIQREVVGDEFDAVADRDTVAQIPALLRASMPRIAREPAAVV